MYMHAYIGGRLVLGFGLSMILYSMFVWWRDVIREATYKGHHTSAVQVGLRYGMILFIVSEIMFFGFLLGIFPLKFSTNSRNWRSLAP